MAKTEITEEEALQMAIDHFLQQAPRNCGVMYEQYTAVAKWLQELAAFKDETPITKKWLLDNGFYENGQRLYKTNGNPFYYGIEAHHIENEVHKSYHFSFSRRHYPMYEATFETVGKLRMFLTLCGLGDFTNQFKS